ncbi:hypothetical protein WJX74_001333 [Apatococcus lobatus]|uniref:AP2/ERF domain-containing protein n=2 Tax=Apatococcus TaxID=904362 RepID=A0AAW1SWU6_9CHLO
MQQTFHLQPDQHCTGPSPARQLSWLPYKASVASFTPPRSWLQTGSNHFYCVHKRLAAGKASKVSAGPTVQPSTRTKSIPDEHHSLGAWRFKSVIAAPGGAACARICIARKNYHLGTFENPATAARAYDWVCINQGRHSRLNYPASEYAAEWSSLQQMSLPECLAKVKEFARKQPVKKSRFKGVYATPAGRFRAAIWHGGRHVELGWYVDDTSAAQAVDKAAIVVKRPLDTLNFPEAWSEAEITALRTQSLADMAEAMVASARQEVRPQSSSYLGVSWTNRAGGKFKSQLYAKRRRHKFISLGYWTSDENAARAWDQAAASNGQSVSKLNFPMNSAEVAALQATPLELVVARLRSQAH